MHLLIVRTATRQGALRHSLAQLKGTEYAVQELNGSIVYRGDMDAPNLLAWMHKRFGSFRSLEDVMTGRVWTGS